MKFTKLLFSVAAIGMLATSCGGSDPTPEPGPQSKYDKFTNMTVITMDRASELLLEFQNQLEQKLLAAITSYRLDYAEGETEREGYWGANYSGHLKSDQYNPKFEFEYEEGSFGYYPHDDFSSEYNAEDYASDVGNGFNKIWRTMPSRALPPYNYTYYYDNTYVAVFGLAVSNDGRTDYVGYKVSKDGITVLEYNGTDTEDKSLVRHAEYVTSYYEEE